MKALNKMGMSSVAKVILRFDRQVLPPLLHGCICSDSFIPEFWFRCGIAALGGDSRPAGCLSPAYLLKCCLSHPSSHRRIFPHLRQNVARAESEKGRMGLRIERRQRLKLPLVVQHSGWKKMRSFPCSTVIYRRLHTKKLLNSVLWPCKDAGNTVISQSDWFSCPLSTPSFRPLSVVLRRALVSLTCGFPAPDQHPINPLQHPINASSTIPLGIVEAGICPIHQKAVTPFLR